MDESRDPDAIVTFKADHPQRELSQNSSKPGIAPAAMQPKMLKKTPTARTLFRANTKKVTPITVKERMEAAGRRRSSISDIFPDAVRNFNFNATSITALHREIVAKLTRSHHSREALQEAEDKHRNILNTFHLRKTLSQNSIALQRREQRRLSDISEQTVIKKLIAYIIHPESVYLSAWYLLVGMIVCIQAVYIPFLLSFDPVVITRWWIFGDRFLGAFFFIDILVHFHVGYYQNITSDDSQSISWKFAMTPEERNRLLVRTKSKIALHYLGCWFWIDAFSAFPINYFPRRVTPNSLHLPTAFQIIGIVRALKLVRIKQQVLYWLQYSSFSNVLRLGRIVFGIFMVVHLMTCIWNGITVDKPSTGLYQGYIESFHKTLLMIMGEDVRPKTTAENVFCSITILFGAVVMALIFGNVAMLVSHFFADAELYQQKMETVHVSMKHLALPSALQERIHMYYKYIWNQYHSLNGDILTFVQELSPHLQLEVYLYMNTDLIKNVQFLQNCSAELVQDLVLQLQIRVCMPQDYIVNEGDIGSAMYFIQRGECEIVAQLQDKARTRILGPGDFFGELALFVDDRHNASVRAHTFCTIGVLKRSSFQRIIIRHPADKKVLEDLVMLNADKSDDSKDADTLRENIFHTEPENEIIRALKELSSRVNHVEHELRRTAQRRSPRIAIPTTPKGKIERILKTMNHPPTRLSVSTEGFSSDESEEEQAHK